MYIFVKNYDEKKDQIYPVKGYYEKVFSIFSEMI